MMLQEHFENSGNWLFRWRSYLPLVLIGVLAIAMRNYGYLGHSETLDAVWEAICLSTGLFGLAIRIHTIGYVPRKTSGRNTKKQIAETLNTTGLYSIVRNPLYVGNFFMGFSISLFPHIWWVALIYILSFWLYYERIISTEEAFLKDKFGDKFIQWASITPAFIPNLKLYRKPTRSFSVKTVLKREYNGFFALIIILFILEFTGDIIVGGVQSYHIDIGWKILLGIGCIVWLGLRCLRKYTSILKIANR